MKKQEKIDALKKIIKGVKEYMPVAEGLCAVKMWLHIEGKITLQEYDYIHSLLDKVRKSQYKDYPYVWKIGAKAPRIKWLKEQIKRLEK